jgi:hypothetical protein
MPVISLPAFLKILTKGTPQKVQLYGRYLQGGGYDFYWPLKEGAHAITVGGEPHADALKAISDIPRETEKKYNLAAFKNLTKWLDKKKPSQFFDAPVTSVVSPGGHLSVKLEPEFGAVIDGQRYLAQLYYAKDTTLSKVAFSLGTRMMQKYLCQGEFTDCQAAILDLRKREVFAAPYDAAAMDLMLDYEFSWADSFFKAQKQQASQVA